MFSGDQIDTIDDHMLINMIQDATVFYRVSPRHKLRIVKVLYIFNFLGLHEVEQSEGLLSLPCLCICAVSHDRLQFFLVCLSGIKVLSYTNFGTKQCFNLLECQPLGLINLSCINIVFINF